MMNLTDPSLYGVTYPQREFGTPFTGPVQMPWQGIPRYLPFYGYGMPPVYPYGMQPLFYPPEKLGTQLPAQFPLYGAQPFLPQNFGYTPPFQTAPILPTNVSPWMSNPWTGASGCNMPFNVPMQGWQRPFWY